MRIFVMAHFDVSIEGQICIFEERLCSTNLDSIQNDVEFTFSILKKRWQILECGIHYCDDTILKEVF